MLSTQERVDMGVLGAVTSDTRRSDRQRGKWRGPGRRDCVSRALRSWRKTGKGARWAGEAGEPGPSRYGIQGEGVKEAWQSRVCRSEVIQLGYHLT